MKRARKERLISTSLIRRLCLSLLLLFGGWASLPMYAQKAVTLNLTNQPFSTFIKQVEQQTDYKFFFEEQSVDVDRLVNVKAQNQDIKVVLDRVLGGTNLTYTIANKKILLKKHESQKPQKGKALPHEISGNVIGEDGSPMIGVSIQVKGKAVGTVTNIDGNYRLVLPNNSDAIVVTYVGYVPQEISLKNNNWQRIVLKEDANMLDAVVVVGYGTVKKRDLTGAISTVKADEMGLTGVSSIGHALEGKAAGLYVRQNSAQPGGGLDILVRGAGSINANNDPLYIVDGFPIAKLDQIASSDRKMDPGTQGVLNFLNPNDVESIEVLKDASATSIYGARAANGVVIITTKRGKEGKAKVSYSYNYSYQKYSDTYDLLSLPEWMEEKNRTTWELWVWNNKVAPWGSKSLEEALASPVNGIKYSRPYTEQEIANAGAGTDWLGLVTRNGHIQEHNINLQGGSQGTQYMLSFNYFNHEGIIRNSGMTRYTMKANIDQEFLNIFKAGLNLTMTRIINDNTQLGSDKWENSGLIRSAVEMGPQIQAYDPVTGKYPTNPLVGTVFFTKILDHNGKVLLENEPQTKRVLKDSTAFLLTDALAESMESSRMYASPGVSLNSTSVPANIPGMSNAGKSGTTTSNVDIWFVGYTPYYTAGIWSGCDDNQKISAIGSSTSYHKRIWKQIMARAHEGLADTGFPVPDSIETASVCRKSGMLPTPGVCEADPRGSAVYTEYFAKGTVPTQVCDHHVAITVCGESGGLPTEFCPLESRHSRTVLVMPEGESGGTDDSRYAMPGPCAVHTQSAVVLPSESETAAPDSETVPETTAPFIPSSPLDDIYIPVGPGYM